MHGKGCALDASLHALICLGERELRHHRVFPHVKSVCFFMITKKAAGFCKLVATSPMFIKVSAQQIAAVNELRAMIWDPPLIHMTWNDVPTK